MRKTELLDLNVLGWLAEKAEGLTIVDDQTLALVNDNDFGLGTVLLAADGTRLAGSVEDCTVNVKGELISGCPCGHGWRAHHARLRPGAADAHLAHQARSQAERTAPAGVLSAVSWPA